MNHMFSIYGNSTVRLRNIELKSSHLLGCRPVPCTLPTQERENVCVCNSLSSYPLAGHRCSARHVAGAWDTIHNGALFLQPALRSGHPTDEERGGGWTSSQGTERMSGSFPSGFSIFFPPGAEARPPSLTSGLDFSEPRGSRRSPFRQRNKGGGHHWSVL